MDKPSWTVVKFIKENTVEAVSSTWILNNKCYWPPFQYEKVISAIRKSEKPNTCWPLYNVVAFRNSTYGNYYSVSCLSKKLVCNIFYKIFNIVNNINTSIYFFKVSFKYTI